MSHTFLIALSSIGVTVFGQLALKVGVSQTVAAGAAHGGSFPPLRLVATALLNPAVVLGFTLYLLGAMLWLYVLARWDLSKAYPLVGAGFVLTLLIGAIFLGERVTWERLLGCLIICAGITLLVRS